MEENGRRALSFSRETPRYFNVHRRKKRIEKTMRNYRKKLVQWESTMLQQLFFMRSWLLFSQCIYVTKIYEWECLPWSCSAWFKTVDQIEQFGWTNCHSRCNENNINDMICAYRAKEDWWSFDPSLQDRAWPFSAAFRATPAPRTLSSTGLNRNGF